MFKSVPEKLHILIIGNSFGVDTMKHVPDIAKSLGVKDIRVGNLYFGGCSLRMHLTHARGDMPVYRYYTNEGDGWEERPETPISYAIAEEDWDYIGIWPGTKDGSRHSELSNYEPLPELVKYVRDRAARADVPMIYNMTWMGEPEKNHPELAAFGNDQVALHAAIAKKMQTVVLPMGEFCCLAPMGTAVMNARTSTLEAITRDNYHLTRGTGRYLAGLAFFGALTGADISAIEWAPEGVDEKEKAIAIASAVAAVAKPFEITKIML